ncbi:MAG: peptidoglycan recognition family protein [Cyanobacteriota bacterium]|nr:peptidoglycan recognition family protein [Cyanobacteriota bacterium]
MSGRPQPGRGRSTLVLAGGVLGVTVVAAACLGLAKLGRHDRSVDLLGQLLAQDGPATVPSTQLLGERAPAPPPQRRWVSPLRASCDGPEGDLVARLQQRLQRLQSSQAAISIHPTNYGERYRRDAFGNRLNTTPQLVVLHETVYGIGSAINTFVTPHPNDDDQVSYHALIGLDGSVVLAVDPSKRAFGAGNSAFDGQWVVTNPSFKGSVNNFALHVSLETPLDGEDAEAGHSGYTAAQYDALAALLSDWMQRFGIPFERITTHAHVDLGGERSDPRSFDWQALQLRLAALGRLCR